MAQAKGSSSRVVVDWENSYGTAKTSGKIGKNIPFISCDVKPSRNLNNSDEIRGNRNAGIPYVGNIDVAGNLVVPIRADSFGWFLKALIGAPTTIEKFVAATAGSDIKTGSPTITIAANGAYTLSVAQTPTILAVGDRIIYEAAGVRYTGYVTTYTNTTTGVLQDKRTGGTACAEITGATVVAIADNLADATPGTVSIATGTATFSATHTALAAGQLFTYIDTTVKYAKIITKLTATTATVAALDGSAPADCTTKPVEWLGIASWWTHTYKVGATADLLSFVLEKAFLDLTTPYYEVVTGCKVNTMEISVGGDGELTATFGIQGSSYSRGTTAYDSAPAALGGTKMQMFQASIKEATVASTIMRDFKMTHTNDLDGDQYVIGGGGVRGSLPEGVAKVSGSLTAQFADATLLTKADGETESSLELIVNPTDTSALSIKCPEVIYSLNGPAIPNPKGIVLDLNWGAFYDNSTDASLIVVELTNQVGAY